MNAGPGDPLLTGIVEAVAEHTPYATPAVRGTTVGDRLLSVEVVEDGGRNGDRGTAGVAHRPPGERPSIPPAADALAVADWARDPDAAPSGDALVARAVGLATLNALSAPAMAWHRGDPFAALDADVDVIATVGLFGPAFRRFGDVTVRVIERADVSPPATPPGVTVETYGTDAVATALRGVDVLFLTGSSLVYGGTGEYLAAADRIPTVVLVGATASFVPDPVFEAGVTMLAGARVTDPVAVERGIRDGACATDLHDAGLEKVYVAAGDAAGVDLA